MIPTTRSFTICPRCSSPTEKALAINNSPSEFWFQCTNPSCNTYINSYVPMSHQQSVHKDNHRFIGNFGGYGTGKTTTSRQELYKHAFITPNGNAVIGANVTSQYEQTIKRDIEADLPLAFVSSISTQKNYIDLINGYRIMFRPFDDPDKLRSYNIDFFLILEASETKSETLTQLKSRIRNLSATLSDPNPDHDTVTPEGLRIPALLADWRKGIIESNPDSGWIRSEILLKSNVINKHGQTMDRYALIAEEQDPAISSHVASSDVNHFLPPNFIRDLIKNKPVWWVSRYVYGSFSYAEGLVYPSALRFLVPDFDIPRHWKRICAYDYGLSDDSVFLFGAVDEIHGILFIYKELRTNNKSVQELATLFHQHTKDIPTGGWICPPIIDPKSAPKRDYEKKSLSDHFLDYGISFIAGQISVDARVFRLNTYFEASKIRIFNSCEGLIKELREYKFKPKTMDDTVIKDKPIDKNNHAINPLEWMVMELPADPRHLIYGIYDKQGPLNKTKPHLQLKTYADHFFADSEPEQFSEPGGAFDMVDYHF